MADHDCGISPRIALTPTLAATPSARLTRPCNRFASTKSARSDEQQSSHNRTQILGATFGSPDIAPAAPTETDGKSMSINPSTTSNFCVGSMRGYFFLNVSECATAVILVILPTEAHLKTASAPLLFEQDPAFERNTHVSLAPQMFGLALIKDTMKSAVRSIPPEAPGKLYTITGSVLASATSMKNRFNGFPSSATKGPT